jgi:hypothetical protein
MSHTPGPWIVTNEDPPRILATDDRATVVAVTTAPRSNPSNMADARLIAAAPELLEALKKIVRRAFPVSGSDAMDLRRDLHHIQEIALQAIAKAEGK